MNLKRFLIASLAMASVVMMPQISRTDVPVTTAVLRDDTPVQEVCRRRDRLTLRLRTQQGGLVAMADSFNRARFAQLGASSYDFGGYSVGGYSAGGNVCGIDSRGFSVCPPSTYSLDRSGYDFGGSVRSFSVCPPSTYSLPSSTYSLPAIESVRSYSSGGCEQMMTEILKVLLQELVSVQSRQNELLMSLLRERSGGGTYEAIPPSPQRDIRPSPSNRS